MTAPIARPATPLRPWYGALRALLTAAGMLTSTILADVAASGVARAESYPTRPVHVVVPYAAGGGVDIVARLVADRLGARLKSAVVVDNKPGAGSNIGAAFVARSAADGYTLLMASPANAINVTLYKSMPYDTLRDLAPIVLVGQVPSVLVVNPDLKARTLAEYVALAKAGPGTITYGSGGFGASEHLSGALFASQAGIRMQHVPYRGGSAAMNDLLGGQVSSLIINQLAALPFIQAGRVRALAVASERRSPELPEVPTFAESGFPTFVVSIWWALMAPGGTPAPVITRLNSEVDAVLADPDVRQKLEKMGAQVIGGSPTQFADFLASNIKLWSEAVRVSGASVD